MCFLGPPSNPPPPPPAAASALTAPPPSIPIPNTSAPNIGGSRKTLLDDDEGAPPAPGTSSIAARTSFDYGHQSLSSDSSSLDIVSVLNTAGHSVASSIFSGSHPDLLQNLPRVSSALLRTASSAAAAAPSDSFTLMTPEIVAAAQARLPADDPNAQNALMKLVAVLQTAGGIAQQKQILAELTILNADSEKSKPLAQAIIGSANFQSNGGGANYQGIGNGANFQGIGNGANFQMIGGGASFQPNGGGPNFQGIGNGANFQLNSGGPNFQGIGGNANFQPPFAGIPYHASPPAPLPPPMAALSVPMAPANMYPAAAPPLPLPPMFRHRRPGGTPAPLFGAFR